VTGLSRTWLADIPAAECADLLEASWLGRLGVVVDGHPEIFPVNHVYERTSGSVLFPTPPGTKLSSALGSALVAFEVDGITNDELVGWSVLVVGAAEEVTDPGVIAAASSLRRAVWALSERSHWLRIRPVKVTGRRISLVDA
jgi:nitroimidazol reductase NimA-like FMN-containing flavoprotein (pyridoxamine 5'-phosphate oxidase superfamily)